MLRPAASAIFKRGDARISRHPTDGLNQWPCTPAWWTAKHAPVIPEWCEDRRHGQADGWRRNDARHGAWRCRAIRAHRAGAQWSIAECGARVGRHAPRQITGHWPAREAGIARYIRQWPVAPGR